MAGRIRLRDLNPAVFLHSVGIGVEVPTVKLDVAGDGKFSGNLTANGNVGIGTGSSAPKAPLHVVGGIHMNQVETCPRNMERELLWRESMSLELMFDYGAEPIRYVFDIQ